MKRIIAVVVLLQFFFLCGAFAQPSVGKIKQKIKTPPGTELAKPPTRPAQPAAPSTAEKPAAAKQAPAVVQPTAAEKEAAIKKAVEFQQKKAEAGSASAQYDLGVRYLKGDGVAKDPETARKWLELSAAQGNASAKKRLEEMTKAVP